MKLVALLLALALAACTEAPASVPKVSMQERRAAAEAALSKTPAARTFDLGEHQLLVFNVPISAFHGRVEYQTCLVWRDREFKTSTLTCPGDSPPNLEAEGSEPEGPRP